MSLFEFFRGNSETELVPASSGTPMPKVNRIGGGRNLGRGFGTATGALAAADADRLTAGWTTTPMNPNELVERCWEVVCARGREAARNKAHAKKFLRLCTTNIVGPSGVQIAPSVTLADGKPDELARKALKEAFTKWGEDPEVTGLLSWHDVQNTIMRTVASDGEVFVRRLKGKQYGKYHYQLQFIDPTRIPIRLKKELPNGNRIFAGIEYTPYGRPVAYYVTNEAPHMYGVTSHQEATRISADEMIHLYVLEMIGQKRGFSWLAGSLPLLHHLDKYTEASVVNARVGASKMGFFEQHPDFAEVPDDDEEEEEIPMDAEPGTFEKIPLGLSFKEWNPQFPQGEYEGFVKTNLHIVASDLGVSYASLSGDLANANFSSVRFGVLPEQDFYLSVQSWLIRRFYSVVYRDWVEQAVLHKTVRIGTTPLRLERIDQYEQAVYQGRRWKYVDPTKEVNSERLQHKGMLKSISQTIRERGDDPEAVFNELADDVERIASAIGIQKEDVAGVLGLNITSKGQPNDKTS
ncbi:phage portal protein [Halodesulfovibrio aestuarii]|uniref:phage portal protein n=1 Tax=Halodesulfovibrio aestuarii TaxID=126333 RepID=UPI003D32A786